MERIIDVTNLESEIIRIETECCDKFEAYQKTIKTCRKLLSDLKKKVIAKGFMCEKDEVYFFKVTKQVPLSILIYYSEVYSFEMRFPNTVIKVQEMYIQKKIKELNKFFNDNIDFVHYMKINQDHFDVRYFTRKFLEYSPQHYNSHYILDPLFNTSHDVLLGKFIASERMIIYLKNKLRNFKTSFALQNYNLKWTSSKVSLTELIYALHSARAINNGNISIKHIADVFQSLFNLEIGDYYRSFSEMKLRKKDRTKFLNELSIAMINNME
ncbi:MAG: RteC domain-containing protein, partial [Eudoraea sp.]